MEEVKEYWQNLSYEESINLFKHSEFVEFYEDFLQGIYDECALSMVASTRWNGLCDAYQYFIAQVYQNKEILNYSTRSDNWNELSDKEKEDRLSGKEIETPGFVDLNKVQFDQLVDHLENDYMFQSSSDAFIINKLIRFYKENSK